MRYGVIYKGSKNQIAEWVYKQFPVRENFYDLFAGGCALTQLALMRNEFKNLYCNDIDGDGINLFVDATAGKFANENRWIGREDFFALKDKEPLIKYLWSFGNNGRDYLYAKDIEPYKGACHYAVMFNDFEPARKLGMFLLEKQLQENKKDITRLQHLQMLRSLQSLESIKNIDKINFSFKDYAGIEIKENSVIYCDPPYFQTNPYIEGAGGSFDHERFYDWCCKQKEFCFISEYYMPEDRFVCIGGIEKNVLICSGGDKKNIERLFIPKHQEEMYRRWKVEEGGFLFDFL